jgi:Ring finger domain
MECPICLDTMTDKLHTTECNHTFHTKCFAKIKGGPCPCCRAVCPTKKTKIVDMKNEIKRIKEQYKLHMEDTKRIVSDRSREMKATHTELNNEIKHLQIIIVNIGEGSLIDSVKSQTDKINELTALLENKKRIVRSVENRILECKDHFETMIALKKYELQVLV